MTVRTTLPSSGSHTGSELLDNVVQHVNRFWNISTIPLTSIAGTGDVVTAIIDPITNVGLVAGMSFTFKAGANNTGAVTLKIGAEAAKPIVTAANVALASGAVLSGTTYLLHYDGTSFLILSVPGENLQGAVFVIDTFTGDGTLTKPVNFPADGLVIIECWAGGGGGDSGGNDGGGGGGGYNSREYSGSDLGATETVTIGTGGAISGAGGDTSVGTLCNAFGGAPGSGSGGGGGGGQLSAGSGQSAGGPSPGLNPGGSGNVGAGGVGDPGDGGDGIFGGGGGGDTTASAYDGGNSLYGGGGGAGGSGGTGGSSVYGGDGGDGGVGGTIPSGGGGRNATGARGEARVRWIS